MSARFTRRIQSTGRSIGQRRKLSALVDKLLEEVGQLRREVGELRQEAGYWKGMFAQAKQKNEKLQKQIDELRAENRQLKDKLYGTKSEKTPDPFSRPARPLFQHFGMA